MEKRTRGRPRGGGSKLNRTETVTIRLDPKLRYLTELAARKQRRTASSFIEWAIEQALSHVELEPGETLAHAAQWLWDPHEADRLAYLGCFYPDLLTFDEQVMWKLIRERLWQEVNFLSGFGDTRDLERELRTIQQHLPILRAHWEDLKRVAAGEADASLLPTPHDVTEGAKNGATPQRKLSPARRKDSHG